jgi:hypothetical protein
MSLAATRTFEDLRPLVFRDHALELQQQLILSCCRPWRADKQGLDTGTSQLLDQQDLIGVSSTEPIGCIDQHGRRARLRPPSREPARGQDGSNSRHYSLRLRISIRWEQRSPARRRTRSARPFGWQWCSPPSACPRIPGRRSPPSSSPAPISLLPPACAGAGSPTTRTRSGTRVR